LGCVLPGLQLETSLHRSSSSSKFTEAHCAILAVISPHLSNLYSSFKKLCDVGRLTLTDEEIRFRYPRLTPREAQVGALLCRGLSTSEIATRLFVAIRTVEVHLAHLYQTLGVHSKRQAIALLTNSGGL
jgi:DNA-binding NarL/FixJ family response regulator